MKNITDRTIDATTAALRGMSPEIAAILHDVPYDPPTLSPEDKALWDSLTEEDRKDTVTVDGRTYIRKIYEAKERT